MPVEFAVGRDRKEKGTKFIHVRKGRKGGRPEEENRMALFTRGVKQPLVVESVR